MQDGLRAEPEVTTLNRRSSLYSLMEKKKKLDTVPCKWHQRQMFMTFIFSLYRIWHRLTVNPVNVVHKYLIPHNNNKRSGQSVQFWGIFFFFFTRSDTVVGFGAPLIYSRVNIVIFMVKERGCGDETSLFSGSGCHVPRGSEDLHTV